VTDCEILYVISKALSESDGELVATLLSIIYLVLDKAKGLDRFDFAYEQFEKSLCVDRVEEI
jgi:hypothetical protein